MTRIYRVVVRGQFRDLTDEQRATLLAEAPEHDLFRSSFSAEGSLTYDTRLQFFNVRYELRERGDDGPDAMAAAATERALRLVGDLFERRGLATKGLKVTLTDMSSIWE